MAAAQASSPANTNHFPPVCSAPLTPYPSPMRLMIALACLPLPALSWEFTADPVCTLSHSLPGAEIVLTYDPARPEYTLRLTRSDTPWPEAPSFALVFEGGYPLQLGTAEHRLTDAGATLVVRDSGFGNVLNGMERNRTAIALTGQTALRIPLDGVTEPLARFRACPEDDPALS